MHSLCEDQLDFYRLLAVVLLGLSFAYRSFYPYSQFVHSYNMPVLLMLTCLHAYALINVGLLVALYIGLIYEYQIVFVALLPV